MAGLRRAEKPKAPPRPKVKVKPPLHQRILGHGAVEVDTIEGLRIELERALSFDLIEYDTYLDCHEALDIREAKAKTALLKATGRYVKPEKTVTINVTRYTSKPMPRWKVKLICVVAAVIVFKFLGFKA
uniref:Uncharacterized protein n=2 Tax=unclassified bacterial viruses TaxID=12333 RepID=A0AAU6VXX6_9VIRU